MVNSKGELFRVIESNAYDADKRVSDCDQHHVDVQVLSPTPGMIPDYVDNKNDAAEICKIINNDNAKLAATFPNRFIAIGALPMQFPDAAINELERIHSEFGMRGIEINSNINGTDLDDPALFDVFEAAADMGTAIFIHPWAGFMEPSELRLKKRMSANKNWRPWLLAMGLETAIAFDSMRCGGVHERLPNLKVLYAHGGGAFTGMIGRLEHGSYCRPDLFKNASTLDPYNTIKNCGVYTDSLTHSPWAFETLIKTIGVDRIAMGSDYPYPLGEIDPFDKDTKRDPKDNICPYENTKTIYPGHMIEHLPCPDTDMNKAWEHFSWIPQIDGGGRKRDLPKLEDKDKQRILSGTAKEWLGLA
jgi:aminocarboxymuconate-semialdehyde decarboxylase